jgi:hypothetical protein
VFGRFLTTSLILGVHLRLRAVHAFSWYLLRSVHTFS